MEDNYVLINSGNVGGNNNTVNVFNSFNSLRSDDLSSLLSEFMSAIEQTDLPEEKKRDAKEYIDTINEESAKEKPKKSVIKLLFDSLKKFAKNEKLSNLIEKLTPIITALIK